MFGQSQMSNTAPFTSSMNELPDAMPLNMLPGSSTAFHPYMQPSQYQSGSNLGPDTMSPMYLMQQQALLSARQQGYHEGIRNQQRRQQLQEQAQQAQHAQQQHSMQQHSTQAHSAPQLQLPAQAQHHLPQPPQPQHDPSGWCQALDPLPSASYSFNNMDMSMSDVLMQAVQPAADKAVSAPQQKQWLIGSEQPQQHLQAYSGASLPEHPTTTAPQHAQQHTAEQAGSQSQPSSMSVLAEAKDILSFHHTQPQYIADEQFVRMSAKLFNCTPAHLPHDLKQNLMGLLSCGVNSIEGYIMPGCVQLTLNALISSDKYQSVQAMGVRQAFEVLMQQGNNRAFWGTDTMLVSLTALRQHCVNSLSASCQ